MIAVISFHFALRRQQIGGFLTGKLRFSHQKAKDLRDEQSIGLGKGFPTVTVQHFVDKSTL